MSFHMRVSRSKVTDDWLSHYRGVNLKTRANICRCQSENWHHVEEVSIVWLRFINVDQNKAQYNICAKVVAAKEPNTTNIDLEKSLI